MNDLPNELLIFIFEYLKTRDLIQCSSVCKRFKLLCQYVKVPELIISKTNENIKGYWFYTNKQFNLQDAINVTTFNAYRSIFRLDKFRRLYFEGTQSEYVQLKLNDLTQLEQVKIHVEDVVDTIHISLANLKMLQVDTYQSDQKLFVTTPELEILKCRNFDVIHLTYPNTIQHLETNAYRRSFLVLENLQFLLVAHTGDFDWFNTLSAFPKLTSLLFNGNRGFVPEAVEDLVKYKCELRKSLPKIYFESVELDEFKKIDEFHSHGDEFWFQINNYKSLTENVFYTPHGINYNQLMKSMKDEIPDDFFKKFSSAQCVHVNEKVEKQDHLFSFLKNFNYLTELYLGGYSLDQSFYSRLGELDQLKSLTVEVSNGSALTSILGLKSTLNFNSLLELKRLTNFYTSFDSPEFFDLTLELFKHLKHFSFMSFFFEGKRVMIHFDRTSNDYGFTYYRYKKCQLDYSGLVCEMNAARSQLIDHG